MYLEKKFKLNKYVGFLFVLIAFLPWIPDFFKMNKSSFILFSYFSKLLIIFVTLYLLNKVSILSKGLEEKHIQVENLNIMDVSSKLFNLNYFHQQLEKEVDRAERQAYPIFLGILELNQNNEMSKILCEKLEDQIAEKIGKLVKDNIRKNVDSAYRYNENVFSVIVTDVNMQQVQLIGDRIIKSFVNLINNSDYKKLTISIGFIQYHHGWDMKTFNQRAYMTMMEAKKNGINQIVAF
ncbi:diguanylate cyclase [Candidatus Poribacteria bacterium]|nr:diguanylate cyclase [Candidatus Poribacteria bacterium]